VFFAITAFYNATGKQEISDFAGLADRSPFLAAAITISLFSLAGLPFLAGFVTKFYLFSAAAAEDLLWLAGVAMVASLISLYYYLKVIREMYLNLAADGEGSTIQIPGLLYGLVGVLVISVILLGVYPDPVVNIIEGATAVILPAGDAAALNLR
jgi:NADH-quinone oxidoreductase subunit N